MKKIILIFIGIILLIPFNLVEASDGNYSKHWATESVEFIESIGYTDIPESYNTPLTTDQWEMMVNLVFEPALKERNDYNTWLYNYTHLTDGNVQREWAIGGIVKLLTMANKAPSNVIYNQTEEYIFSDFKQASDKNQGLIYIAYDLGIVKGYTDGTFGPQKEMTFAEGAVFLHRTYNILYNSK